jgi:PAS domain S-box-containing protein
MVTTGSSQDRASQHLTSWRRYRILLGSSVLLLSLLLTAWAWYANKTEALERAKTRFHQEVDRSTAAIHARLEVYEDALYGTRSFFEADPRVSRESFHDYVANLRIRERFPGIQGIGYAVRIPAGQVTQHIEKIRRDGFPKYSIRPEGEREEYTSIIYLEPFDWRNQRAFGYDMFTEPVRRAAMERARDSGLTSISGKVKLVQETETSAQAGFLMYLPVYQKGVALAAPQDRRSALLGYVYSPFRMNDLMNGVIRDSAPLASFEIFSATQMSPESLLYRSADTPGKSVKGRLQLAEIAQIEFGGQTWMLRFSSLPSLDAVVGESRNALIIPVGLLVSLLLSGLIFSSGRTEARAIHLAGTMTARLRESEERYRNLFELNPHPVWVYDRETLRFLAVNAAAVSAYGYSEEEFLAMTIKDIRPPEDVPALVARVSAIRDGQHGTSVWRHCRKDGCLLDVEVSYYSLTFGDRPANLVISVDVTERKLAEEEIKALNRELQSRNAELTTVNRELESFSYSVSHDLRAPLRAIDGFSAALLQDYPESLDREARQYLGRIRAGAERMGQLIDDLLRLARTTRQRLTLQTVNLSSLAQEIASHLQELEPQRTAVFIIAPSLKAEGDRGLLRLALENLLGNAWKFTAKQDRARIEFGQQTLGNEKVYFVADNGAGFDMEYVDKLFGAFQRLHDQSQFAGTGIGLATVQRIVRRHGGRIWAQSSVGQGAIFYFVLSAQVEELAMSGSA